MKETRASVTGKEGESMQERVTELATVAGDWCSIPQYLLMGRRTGRDTHWYSSTTGQAVNSPTPLACTFCDVQEAPEWKMRGLGCGEALPGDTVQTGKACTSMGIRGVVR